MNTARVDPGTSAARSADVSTRGHRREPYAWRAADLCAKGVLCGLLLLVLVNPRYGNLEGKAPVTRAVTYPLLALAVPLAWRAMGKDRAEFPWRADLAVTVVCFSDILGNRLDLYDSVAAFDDYMHLQNTALFSGAVASLTLSAGATFAAILERTIAVGLGSSLAWEVFEFLSFMTQSSELPTAYADTLTDLTLGALGAGIAAVVVHAHWRNEPGAPPSEASRWARCGPGRVL